MTKTTLKATLQKSYYNKAIIFEDDNYIVLRSYNTDVLAIDKSNNKLLRLWNGWSRTTSKHINDFLMLYGFATLNKKEWLSMNCINPQQTYNIYMSNGFFTYKSNCLLTIDEIEQEVARIKENNNRVCVWYE